MVKKILALAMVIGVMGVVLAGCQGSEDTATDTAAPATGDAAATGE